MPSGDKHDVVSRLPENWSATARSVAKNLRTVLEAHYPKWRWAVGIDEDAGYYAISNMDIPSDYVFFINPHDIDPEYKIAIRAGGELLEAFGIARAKPDQDKHSQFLEDNPVIANPYTDAVPRKNPGYKRLNQLDKAVDNVMQATAHLERVKMNG